MVTKQHRRRKTFAGAFVLALSLMFESTPALGQASNPIPAAADSTKQKKVDDVDQKEKRGSLVIAPVPISSPAFGSGLLLITAYVFKCDKEDSVSPRGLDAPVRLQTTAAYLLRSLTRGLTKFRGCGRMLLFAQGQ